MGAHLGDGSGQCCLAMIDVANGADIQMRLGPSIDIIVAVCAGEAQKQRLYLCLVVPACARQ